MRSVIAFGALALFTFASADTTGELVAWANQTNSEIVRVVTSGAVTVTATTTVSICPPESECSDAALSNPPSTSTGTTNALTILSCALTPCTTFLTVTSTLSPLQTTTNALTVLSSAEATNSPVPPETFPPALYSSFGLSSLGSQSTSSGTSTGLVPVPVGPATASTESSPTTYPASSAGVASTTLTTTVPSSAIATSAASEVTSTTATVVVPSSSEVSPVAESTSYSSSGTTVVPIPVPVTSASSAASAPSSSGASAETTLATSTGSAASSPSAYASSTKTGESVSPVTATTSSPAAPATTTAAPTNAANGKELPAAMGGLVAAMAALLFI